MKFLYAYRRNKVISDLAAFHQIGRPNLYIFADDFHNINLNSYSNQISLVVSGKDETDDIIGRAHNVI